MSNVKKIICIDYDKTYTVMPELINCIIDKSKELSYTVILATMRYSEETCDELESLKNKLDGVYFTCREAKMLFLNKLDIYPDLWVDDNPAWLFTSSI